MSETFVEPEGETPAGLAIYTKSASPYERWMEEEGIPIFRGIGVRDTRELELGDWKRRNARGSFLHIRGVETVKGMYVIEVPEGDATNPEKHMYDEFFLVIEGRGSTEVWRADGSRHVFEWQPGSLFMIPINASYRLVNATGSRALLLAANNAPPIINIYQSREFVFENDWSWSERGALGAGFFAPNAELEKDPVRKRAAIRSNLFPDVVNCELPLDNQRAPGYRRIQPLWNGFIQDTTTGGFVAQYPTGRYSKAHYHESGAVLVCLRGEGYTLNWPVELGPTPWADGHADRVNRVDYVPGGLVAASPGGGGWFHQHFGVGAEPLRVLNYWGGPYGRWGSTGDKGKDENDKQVKAGNMFGIHEGGRSILYHQEDPFVRGYFQQRLDEVGVEFTMPERLFMPPAAI